MSGGRSASSELVRDPSSGDGGTKDALRLDVGDTTSSSAGTPGQAPDGMRGEPSDEASEGGRP